MEYRTNRNEKFMEKNEKAYTYALRTGLVFVGLAMLAVILSILRVQESFINIHTWGHWLAIPGVFILLGSRNIRNNSRKMYNHTMKTVDNATGEQQVNNITTSKVNDSSMYESEKGTMYCSLCGTKTITGTVYCSHCGSQFAK